MATELLVDLHFIRKAKNVKYTFPPPCPLRVNHFREDFNNDRPHETLDKGTPASVYSPSPRPIPRKILLFKYPIGFKLRYLNASGWMRWNSIWVQASIVCSGEDIGFKEIDDGIREAYYGHLKIGGFYECLVRFDNVIFMFTRQYL